MLNDQKFGWVKKKTTINIAVVYTRVMNASDTCERMLSGGSRYNIREKGIYRMYIRLPYLYKEKK